jgi:beta-glucosidase
MKLGRSFLVLFSMSALSQFALGAQPASTIPSDSNYRLHHEWCKGAEDRLAAMQGKNCDLIFIGDSITGMWDGVGLAVWNRYYAPRGALNCGAGGDSTQNALWRLETWKGLASFKPKAVVLLIGTNNIGDPVEEMTAGITAVLNKVRLLYPSAKVVLVSVLPRADAPGHADKTRQVNARIKGLADGKTVLFLDIAPKFVALGDSFKGLGPDKLHLVNEGYAMWAESLEPVLRPLLGEK